MSLSPAITAALITVFSLTACLFDKEDPAPQVSRTCCGGTSEALCCACGRQRIISAPGKPSADDTRRRNSLKQRQGDTTGRPQLKLQPSKLDVRSLPVAPTRTASFPTFNDTPAHDAFRQTPATGNSLSASGFAHASHILPFLHVRHRRLLPPA